VFEPKRVSGGGGKTNSTVQSYSNPAEDEKRGKGKKKEKGGVLGRGENSVELQSGEDSVCQFLIDCKGKRLGW